MSIKPGGEVSALQSVRSAEGHFTREVNAWRKTIARAKRRRKPVIMFETFRGGRVEKLTWRPR